MRYAIQDRIRRLGFWPAVFLVSLALALYATVVRFAQGLGAATHLSDAFPWGLWIGFDVLVGVGLAAGGFVVAATVHVLRIERYEPIARPALLTAFLGYLLVIVALLFDLGMPDRIWHPLVMWNPHSVMFEVAWCVTLYTLVLALEFSPLLFERLGLEKPLRIVRAAFVPLVIVGVLLSTLHQSSLGSLYVIVPDKLHGLWYSGLLPVFFFLTAVAGGLAMTIFESFMSFRAFGRRLEADLLRGLGRVIVVVLGVYALLKFQDLAARGNLALAFVLTPESVLFWGEMVLGVLLPMALFASRKVRHDERGLFFAALLTILGFVVNRLNVAITGMAASSGTSYVPSWMERAVTVSLVGAGFFLFALAVKYLPVFPAGEEATVAALAERRRPALGRGLLATLWALLMVGALGVIWSGRFGEASASEVVDGESAPQVIASIVGSVQPDVELRLPEPYVFPSSEDSPGEVTFDHSTHVELAGYTCSSCHASLFALTEPGQPLAGRLGYEEIHEGPLCASCHDGETAFATDDDCSYCHR